MELLTPKLLITDDDRDLRQTLGDVLERRGFSTALAADGLEGLSIVRQTEIHLIVVDFHMPRLTGLEMLAQLYEEQRDVPCILMSGKLDDTIRQTAAKMHVFSILEKPIRIAELSHSVASALKAKYGWVA